jgi:hypothetical protein
MVRDGAREIEYYYRLFVISMRYISDFAARDNKCVVMRLQITRHKRLASAARLVMHPVNTSLTDQFRQFRQFT